MKKKTLVNEFSRDGKFKINFLSSTGIHIYDADETKVSFFIT